MTAPLFTVLMPVHRPPDLLPYAVGSVLAQSCEAFELLIICDGAPAETVARARAFAGADRRVRVFAHPKGERHGEAYRHAALQHAAGRYVCQISDDDLWFDNHLAEAEGLMATADFGNLFGIRLRPDGRAQMDSTDLAIPVIRSAMLSARYNPFGPTCVVYRLETYRALPVGWSPAPPDLWTDLWMWRKFLALPGVRFATRPVATSLIFPAPLRSDQSLEQRRQEISRYAKLIRDAGFRDELWRAMLLDLSAQIVLFRREVFAATKGQDAANAEVARLAGALADIVAAAGDAVAQTRLAQAALALRPPSAG
jgi:glycosyltransferase involved in cell wall biosynthesis